MKILSIIIKGNKVASPRENAGFFRLAVFETAKDLQHVFVSLALRPLAEVVADAASFPKTSRHRAKQLKEISKFLTNIANLRKGE
jgi:hypothetical protein